MIQFISTLLIIVSTWTMQVSTTIEGKVTDNQTGEPLIFGVVKLFRGEKFISSTETDIDGNYFFSSVQSGIYNMEVEYVGYTTQRQTNIVIKSGRTNRIDFKIDDGKLLTELQIIYYKAPLIEMNSGCVGFAIPEKISLLPTKSFVALLSETKGLYGIKVIDTLSHPSPEIVNEIDSMIMKNQYTDHDVTIYPNPAKHEINIECNDSELPAKIEVFSATGQLLLKVQEPSNGISKANISNLISGQYYLKMTYADKVFTKSFIKIE
jgi:Carboxypeptidase regulatory-like domain/Secretion system C-terminal sorting domain